VPSIIVNPPRDVKVSTLEVFGPVTCVYSFTRLDDAIAAANSLPMAFQASIFTEHLRTAFDAAERLVGSAVVVNDHTAFRTDWMPFAGRRQSGYGVGGIPWTMREMTEQKMIVFKTEDENDGHQATPQTSKERRKVRYRRGEPAGSRPPAHTPTAHFTGSVKVHGDPDR
jgi:acyl-CoA reductase-like NAD-dependent aldehyde dehydrogenase